MATNTATKPEFNLPAAVYSPQLLEAVTYDIERYLDWYRDAEVRKTVGAKVTEEPTHSAETALVIEAWLAGRPATVELLEELVAYLKNLRLPEVHIMLAAMPNRAQRTALVDWFHNNTTQQLLLSFVADRNLGGGVVIRTPNRVFDYTWKQELLNGRDKLAEILKRV
ncbi:MAG TPA: F0F1 ATP synthase subunit delta [Candidatus Saccharimonadia bacterium]|jgi:hypothetical protein